MSDLIIIAAAAIVAYLLGSISAATIISRATLKKDIRKLGSGNPGFTNSLRVMGKRKAAAVFAVDFLKGAAAVVAARLFVQALGAGETAVWFASVFVVVGHSYPVFFDFKGGKGISTTAGVVTVLDWRVALLAIGLYVAIVAITKYSSLGSILAGLSVPLFMSLFHWGDLNPTLTCAMISMLLVFWHRANITRLRNGTENKMFVRKK